MDSNAWKYVLEHIPEWVIIGFFVWIMVIRREERESMKTVREAADQLHTDFERLHRMTTERIKALEAVEKLYREQAQAGIRLAEQKREREVKAIGDLDERSQKLFKILEEYAGETKESTLALIQSLLYLPHETRIRLIGRMQDSFPKRLLEAMLPAFSEADKVKAGTKTVEELKVIVEDRIKVLESVEKL